MAEEQMQVNRAVVRVEKAVLAKLDNETLVKTIDRHVRSAFNRAEKAKTAYDEAVQARRDYIGDDPVEAKRLDDVIESARLVVRREIDDIEAYLDEQKELFASRGLEPNRAYKEAVVPTGELLPNGKEIFRIVKRGETLEEADPTDDDLMPSVRASRDYSDRIGLARDQTRGRYNDGHMLIEQSAASVDPEEVVPMGSACM